MVQSKLTPMGSMRVSLHTVRYTTLTKLIQLVTLPFRLLLDLPDILGDLWCYGMHRTLALPRTVERLGVANVEQCLTCSRRWFR